MKKRLYTFLSWFVSLLVPLTLIFCGLRLLLTHSFLEIEYRLPGFPPDTYGFSLEDRLHWSGIALDYLITDADISYLAELTFPDGTALYNDRELRHMDDVKNVLDVVMWVGYGICLSILSLGIWAQWGHWWVEYRHGLRRGGWWAVGLVIMIVLFSVISFRAFFAAFHLLFFEGTTWMFYYSDTLIRLFPIRFWQDTFIVVGVVTLGGGLALGLIRKQQ